MYTDYIIKTFSLFWTFIIDRENSFKVKPHHGTHYTPNKNIGQTGMTPYLLVPIILHVDKFVKGIQSKTYVVDSVFLFMTMYFLFIRYCRRKLSYSGAYASLLKCFICSQTWKAVCPNFLVNDPFPFRYDAFHEYDEIDFSFHYTFIAYRPTYARTSCLYMYRCIILN